MPRYRHKVSGVVVGLPDDHAVHLGSEWVEVGGEKPKAPPTPRRRKTQADNDSE